MPKSSSRSLSVRKRSRRQRWTPEKASAILAEVARSGLSVHAFAAREGLDAERLYRWRHRLEAKNAAATFVEVRPSRRSTVEVILRSGHVLFVSESMDADALRLLVDALDRDKEC